MTQVTLGKSRVGESRTSGSVRAKAEWLTYSTVIDPTETLIGRPIERAYVDKGYRGHNA